MNRIDRRSADPLTWQRSTSTLPPDPAAMAARIAVLLAHEERRVAMGNAGRARVTRDFAEQSMIEGFERATEIARDRSRWRT